MPLTNSDVSEKKKKSYRETEVCWYLWELSIYWSGVLVRGDTTASVCMNYPVVYVTS